MNERWNTQNRKGYPKIHVAVNIKTKEILALEITDEKVHDGKLLKKLVDHVLDSSSSELNMAKVKSVLADGAVIQIPTFSIWRIKGSNQG